MYHAPDLPVLHGSHNYSIFSGGREFYRSNGSANVLTCRDMLCECDVCQCMKAFHERHPDLEEVLLFETAA